MNRVLCCVLVSAVVLPPAALAGDSTASKSCFMTGVDANYSLDLAKRVRWKVAGKELDLLRAFRQSGANSFRVRVWTGDDG